MTTKPKIAIITPVFPPYGGGIGRVAAEDARILSSADFNVEVFSPSTNLKPVLRFGNAAFVPQLLWKIGKFDVVHLHYPFFGGAEIIWLAKKMGFFKGKLIITYHMDVVGSGWLGKFFAFHTKFIMPRIISSADKIIITSTDYATHSNISGFAEKFVEIPIGVDDDFFRPAEKNAELLEKLNITDEKIILFVGGLDSAHYFKGLEYLLSAGKKIKNNFKIIVVGSGNLKEEYEKMAESAGIKDKVIFAGSPAREDLLKFYNMADVFVLPSVDKSEAFGIVLLEAMACGAPVVASNLYGVRTLVADNGFLAEPKNAEDLSEKINAILSDAGLAKKMGESGRKKVEEKYSYKKVGEKLIGIYKKKKVCLINNLYGENARGGAEKVVKIIADGLNERGSEVFIISSKPSITKINTKPPTTKSHDRELSLWVKEYGIFPLNLCWYGNLAKHGMFFRLVWHIFDVFNLHSFFAVRKILKKEKPDIVWTHNLMGLGFTVPLAIKSLKIKHIHTLHDVQLSSPSGLIIKAKSRTEGAPSGTGSKENSIFGQKLYEIICRTLFGSPDIVVSPSKWLLDFYIEKGFFPESKKAVLQNPVCDVDSPNKSENDSEILNIFYLGQIEDHKGIIFAVDALKKSSLNFVLHIAGDGERLEEIKKLTEGDSRFIIYGKKTGAELEEIWKKINLAVVPSLCYENSPTVIFENLMRKIPVIASNIGGIPEILPPEFLFEAGNEADFVEKIKWFSENKNQLPGMQFSGINTADYIEKILVL